MLRLGVERCNSTPMDDLALKLIEDRRTFMRWPLRRAHLAASGGHPGRHISNARLAIRQQARYRLQA